VHAGGIFYHCLLDIFVGKASASRPNKETLLLKAHIEYITYCSIYLAKSMPSRKEANSTIHNVDTRCSIDKSANQWYTFAHPDTKSAGILSRQNILCTSSPEPELYRKQTDKNQSTREFICSDYGVLSSADPEVLDLYGFRGKCRN
jgi:hypothetical protein